ncbi:hypothetical protein M513_13540 [Trichuris suis]|nr:hypothetical protein M513_13540 [Trichuris suis]
MQGLISVQAFYDKSVTSNCTMAQWTEWSKYNSTCGVTYRIRYRAPDDNVKIDCTRNEIVCCGEVRLRNRGICLKGAYPFIISLLFNICLAAMWIGCSGAIRKINKIYKEESKRNGVLVEQKHNLPQTPLPTPILPLIDSYGAEYSKQQTHQSYPPLTKPEVFHEFSMNGTLEQKMKNCVQYAWQKTESGRGFRNQQRNE